MKKIIALLLITSIILSTFLLVGCDSAKVALGVLDLIEGDTTTNDLDININLGGGTNKGEHVHSIQSIPAVESTCYSTGLTEGKYCTTCGKTIISQQKTQTKPHTPSDWIIDVEATTEKEGSKHIECTVCEQIIKTQTIGKLTADTQYSLVFTLNENGTSYSVTGFGNASDTSVIIPSTYNNLPVTAIGDYAFTGCKTIKTITIPTSVTTLGENIFFSSSITNVNYEGTVDEWFDVTGVNHAYTNISIVVCKDGYASQPTITIWVSTTTGVKEFIQLQINNFINKNPQYSKYTFKIETVGEGDAAAEVLKDVATAPDLYCFSQDQISRLVQAGALSPLGKSASETVIANNDAGSVNAVTVNNLIYAYPMTSDNGYFLYYDSNVISDEEAKTLEGIIAACERAGKKFAYNSTNGWYTAAFFFAQPAGGGAPLCTSTWTYSNDGKTVVGVNDTLNSANGLIAMRGMSKLTTSNVFFDTDHNFSGTAAAINGIWNEAAAQAAYGNYMKATKLPTFTVDGVEYQMGSFSGNKLLGCKPQSDPEKAKLCSDLALYLTSYEAQLERYYEFAWGPSNLQAQANEDVKSNVVLSAILAQNVYAQPQGVIPGDWWAEITVLGEKSADPTLTVADFEAALAEYEARINSIVRK